MLLITGGAIFILNIGDWLTYSEEPEKADLIICLNGNKDRIKKAVELLNQGIAGHILVTSSSMRDVIVAQGVPETAIKVYSGKYNSTYEEATGAVQFMVGQEMSSAVIVSDGYHLYRARWTFERLKKSNAIEFSYTASGPMFGNREWWRDTQSRKFVLNEIPKVAYYWIGHGLLGIETDPQWINATESWYNKLLDHLVSTPQIQSPIS